MQDDYSVLASRALLRTSASYTLRLIIGQSGNWQSAPRTRTVWSQNHDPFTQTTDGSDYTFISGEQSTTCGGFDGLHNKYQGYSYTSDPDSNDAVGCWWMQIVPNANYNGLGYLDGYGGVNHYHFWESLWIR